MRSAAYWNAFKEKKKREAGFSSRIFLSLASKFCLSFARQLQNCYLDGAGFAAAAVTVVVIVAVVAALFFPAALLVRDLDGRLLVAECER